jgi:MFS family permease
MTQAVLKKDLAIRHHNAASILVLSDNPDHNKSLWAISWVSFFWSTASVMVFTLLPMFLTEVLGASKTKLGMIEGVAVFMAFVAKVFAGVLSDYLKTRKSLILLGSLGSILIKPMFALAGSITWVFAAKSIDRFSKGIRSAPTEALIADLSPKKREGGSFGARYAFYMLGAVFGGGIASLLMHLFPHNYRLVFWLSTIPASLAFIVLYVFVKEPAEQFIGRQMREWHFKEISLLPPRFWKLLGVAFILMHARFSEAFLTLRAKDLGWAVAMVPLIMVLYDLIYAASAMPVGKVADRFNRKKML